MKKNRNYIISISFIIIILFLSSSCSKNEDNPPKDSIKNSADSNSNKASQEIKSGQSSTGILNQLLNSQNNNQNNIQNNNQINNQRTTGQKNISGEDILKRALDARGGANSLKQFQTVKLEIKMKQKDHEMPIKLFVKNPEKFRVELESQGKTLVFGFDGKQGWSINPVTKKYELIPEKEFAQIKEQFKQPAEYFISPLILFKSKGLHPVSAAEQKDDEREFYVVQFSDSKDKKQSDMSQIGPNDVMVFFDKETGLDYKYFSMINIQNQSLINIIHLKNNKKVKNWTVPSLMETYISGEKVASFILSKVEINDPMSDALFNYQEK